MEPSRGVYRTPRAAALVGVPVRTLNHWAKSELVTPSVSSQPYFRMWSWGDLVALRAIDWLRKTKPGEAEKTSIAKIREALAFLRGEGLQPEELRNLTVVSASGEIYIRRGKAAVSPRPGHQAVEPGLLNLVAPYESGPDLLEPRPHLRIVPGKLGGEPHLANTRIQSATVFALAQAEYDIEQISAFYPGVSIEALREAIDLEQSLARAA